MLSPFELEKEYKERWKKKFQNDIIQRRNKEIEEKHMKAKEEYEFLQNLKQREEDYNKQKEQKRVNYSNYQHENQMYHIKKKQFQEELKAKKKEEKYSPSLDLRSEERIIDHKNHIMRLEELVDKNYENMKNYLENSNRQDKFLISKTAFDPLISKNTYQKDLDSSNRLSPEVKKKIFFNENEPQIPKYDAYSNSKKYDANYLNDYFNFKNYVKKCGEYNLNVIENEEKKKLDVLNEKKKGRNNNNFLEDQLTSDVLYKKQQVEKRNFYASILDSQIQSKSPMMVKTNSLPRESSERYRLGKISKQTLNKIKSLQYLPIDHSQSSLPHNPILNPVHDFRYNKYIIK